MSGVTCVLYTVSSRVTKKYFAYRHPVRQRTLKSNLEGEAVLQPSVNATGQVGWWHAKTEMAWKWKKAHMWELQQAPA